MRYTLTTDLSDHEIYLIGMIVAQWGFIESEIFEQTILSFGETESIPSSVKSNVQFSTVLELWHDRVAKTKSGAKRKVLTKQYERLKHLIDFRQAIVHSRWEWRPGSPDVITAVRAHKHNIKRVQFTIADLTEFSTTLGEIRYSLRYPGGLRDRVAEMAQAGGAMSRKGWELFLGLEPTSEPNKRGESE